jgi:hypothetical protein
MQKLILRLLAVILLVYAAGSVAPLFATQQQAPPPSPAPPPAPPPSGPAQVDTKLQAPPPSAPRDYGDHGCCGGGGGPATPPEPAKPGESTLQGLELVGRQFDSKGEDAKKDVDAAYAQARKVLVDRIMAKGETANYQQEIAGVDAGIAAGKARHYRNIDRLVKKAKANASARFLGAKVPDDATSSYDIEAAVPSVNSLVRELSGGK